MAATIKDVSAYTGLSTGTISNYINGKGNVSQEKQKLIREAMNNLGYRLNVAGRSLRTNSFQTIGILIPDFGNVYLLRVISIIEDALEQCGYGILVVSYGHSPDKERSLIGYLAGRTDGIIYVPSNMDSGFLRYLNAIRQEKPIVIFDEVFEGIDCDCVIVDSKEVTEKAVTALINKGHREIGILLGPEGRFTTNERLFGYIKAQEASNLPVRQENIVFGDYSKSSGKRMCEELLNRNSAISAVFASGYRIMLGALSVLCDRNLSEKIEVFGYDAKDIEDITKPKLPYVYQPYDQIAKEITSLILTQISGGITNPPQRILLAAELRNI